ncbi:hypothetical protein Vadar_012524 [Vaccinium darrowii]|uniref:Uncharacterized protein n=1 Tax=Vaccinium darrowii TaxID=229202 RepID=A0ACB7YUP0_9ERIC|nr:hypothetical protein Vadar_012524 [Vaccinium darrowii]
MNIDCNVKKQPCWRTFTKEMDKESKREDYIKHLQEHNQCIQRHDLNSSVTEFDDDSPRSVVRIPKSYISNSDIPMTPLPKGKRDNKVKDAEDSKPDVKATSVLRPRAVLSSPDNDGAIRNRNKAKAELLSGLKNHNLCQNRHTRCKVTPKRSTSENSITKKGEPKEVADSKSELKGRRRSTLTEPSQPTQKVNLRKGKPNSEVKV